MSQNRLYKYFPKGRSHSKVVIKIKSRESDLVNVVRLLRPKKASQMMDPSFTPHMEEII